MSVINKLKKIVVQNLFPQNIKCVTCDQELMYDTHYNMCSACIKALPKNNAKTCIRCGEPIASEANYCLRCKSHPPVFTRSFSPLLYSGAVTNLIRNFKYNNKRYLSVTLGNFLVESYVLNDLSCNLVLPVPLHQKRQKSRGFNQAELLANQLNEKLNLPVYNNVLVRVKNTKSQTNLNKQQRQQNVEQAFSVQDTKLVNGKTVLLVDDVFTTGATLNECAKVLFKHGAKKVYCLTIAHTQVNSAV